VNEANWTYRLPMETSHLDETPAIRQRMEVICDIIDHTGRNGRASLEVEGTDGVRMW
jgi:hypothetical protein